MADFAAVLELSSLDGTNGFQLNGVAVGDYAGLTVSSAGDINHDGIDDFMVSAYRNDTGGSNSGATYVVFGTASGFPANVALGALNGADGFRISGAANSQSGDGLAGRGDFNGDGIDDLVLGARRADALGNYTGSTYVLFGKDTAVDGAFAASLTLTALNGTTGFRISGQQDGESNGRANTFVGDFNGDGFDDLLSGSPLFDATDRATSGASYVLFGSDAGFAPSFSWSTLDGTNGFRIDGAAANLQSGETVGAGDFNGDGLADLIIGYRGGNGGAYIVFGQTGPMAPVLDSATLDGVNGFVITGPAAVSFGRAVNSAGDVNGDGLGDVIIGAYLDDPGGRTDAGAAYVVFGTAAALGPSFSASALDGANGFRIDGEFVSGAIGMSVSAAGDINGDGLGDLLIGGERLNINGVNSGGAYVVFGRSDGFAATLALSSLDGTNGFRINGELAGDALSEGRGISAAGDVNNDGYDDLLVGARWADPNGNYSGAAYVIYGRRVAETFAGTGVNDIANGSSQADDLSGGDGNDVLSGLAGADALRGGALSDILSGGDGADDLIGGGGGDILNGDAGDDQIDGGEGADKLFGGDDSDTLVGGLGNDRCDGGSDIDTLTGGAGNDTLDGGTGADVMSGGSDNDIYIVDDAGDQTIELAAEGYDIVRTGLDGWVLADNIEALQLQGGADIDGSGNGGANNLQGNAGANSLDGGAGVDTINGNDGDDVIIGGLGNDLLRGGTGADTFVVRQESIATPVLETDQVYDFDAQDIIDLSAIDANTRLDGNQAFVLVGAFTKPDAAHDADVGQMTLTFAGGITTLRLDINGDGKVDYQMKINGDVTGDSGGWLL